MNDLKNISRIYFIGIGGIGMSALAKYFYAKNVSVSGYDKTSTLLTQEMERKGIKIHYTGDIQQLDREAQLVVYTPAVPQDNIEFTFYRENNYTIVKRSDVLGEISKTSFNICVAGTHGKTTISTMIAHILRDSGYGCNAFLGGISVNYSTNFWSSENNVCVAEADEYDRSFLKLEPDIAVISAMDADHLDIYGTEEAMQNAFVEFSGKIKPGGLLISKYGLPKSKQLKATNHTSYSLQNDAADAYTSNIKMTHGRYEFDVMTKNWMIDNIELNMGGMHNVENSVAAIVVAHHLGINNEKIRKSIKNFKGVRRRFEYIIAPALPGIEANEQVIFIDDYAHHPVELKALITGAKSLFSKKKCTVVFQPHLYSRTRDLANDFAESLDLADEVILLPIYPARELPVVGVSSNMILDKMNKEKKQVLSEHQLLKWVKENQPELFITAGAGDIDKLVEPLQNILLHKK
jgi:UDP-N-acetylmuramate--alanine ligase